MSSMKKYLGGLYSSNNSHTTFTGGFDKNSNYNKYSIRVGNAANDFIKNKLIEWKSFNDVYKDKKHVDYYESLINMVNMIVPVPTYITNETKLWMNVNSIYNMEDEQILNIIANSSNIYRPIKIALRHLFMIYKMYIELLLQTYVSLRNKYIQTHNLKDKKQNFDKLCANWNIIDADNNLQSSSPMLLLNFPPNNFSVDSNIETISWTIHNKKIQKQIDKFLHDMKKSKFGYIGYCPHAIPERFAEIIKFPLYSLIEVIYELSPNHINVDKCNNVVKCIHDAEKSIADVKNIKFTKFKKKKIKYCKFPKSKSRDVKIKIFTEYIDGFLDLYKNVKIHIEEHEKKVSTLVKKISVISDEIEKLSNSFLITL